ncbi:N-acetylmuramoyl-L-alanine amidase [Clostridium sporogenes]|nr:N-acetylmuramoyl-L-alanine amidase [Clostridium sporogenes]
MNKKKSYLALNIILIFFMIELLILPIKVQAASNISINLKAPIHEGVIEDKELNIDGEIESISKIKLAYVYIDNNNVGQAKLNELEFKENTYKTKLEYNKDISSLKDGVYNLKILAIDEQDNKEEKEISIKIKRNQEEVSDNRVNIYEEQLVENDKNIVQRNLEYDNVKISSTEKALTTVYNKATISNLEVSLNGTVVTNGKLEQGKTYTIKGNGNSANGVLYQFWIKDPYTQVWQMIRDYGTGNSMNWTPTRTGKYLVGIHVKDKNSKERLDDHKYVEYDVEQNSSKATISNLEVSLNGTIVTNSKLEQGKTYTIKGNGNSSNGVLYQFWIKDPYTQVWQMIRDYGTGNSMNWTPTRTGKYLVGIHVKDKNSKERLDDHKYVEYNVEQSSSKATISNLEVSLNGTVVANGKLEQGKTYTIKGNGNSANGVLYQFWIKDPYTQVWQMIRDYGTGNSMNWTPTRTGKYLVGIHVKDKNSKERLDDHKYVEYNVEQNSSKATISNLEVSLNGVLVTNGKLEQGKTYTIKGNGNSANGVLYQFWIKDPYTQVWQMIRDYGTGNSMNWTPTRTGKYLVGIHVKDKNSKERLDDHKYLEYNVEQSSSKATISNLEVSLNGVLVTNGNLEQGKTYAIKGNGNSANGVLYQFWIKDPYTQVWQMIRDYGTGNSVNWDPTRTGQYLVGIHVKDKYSKEKLDDHKYVEYNVAASNKRTIVIDAGHGGYDSGAVGPTGIKEKDVTLKVALKVGKILENNGIRVIYTRTSDNVSWPSNESQDLAARVAIANNNNTDLFVSIHANSFNGSAHGTETYYYDGSAKGKEAATAVQKELINSIGLYDRGVKTAGYYVLRNTISPSILVELGFIDNRNEEVLLNSDWFQQKCAEAIAKGIIGTSFI